MSNITHKNADTSIALPVIGLTFFAIASGFLMSLIPLSLSYFGISSSLTPWLASVFYFGLLLGATCIQKVIKYFGHRRAFILFLSVVAITVVVMLLLPNPIIWLTARFVAGMAIAGVFVVVESWLLMADCPKKRVKRLGLYMVALYGGSAAGQLAISVFGTQGIQPYLVVLGLLFLATLAPLVLRSGQPVSETLQRINRKEMRYINRPAIIGCIVSGLLLGPIYGLMPLYLSQSTAFSGHTGLLMASVILGGMAVQPLASALSTRMSKSLLMAIFCLLGCIAVMGILESSSLLMMASSLLLLGASSFALYPIAITLASDTLPIEKMVAVTELMLLCYSVGSVLGPLMATVFTAADDGLVVYLGVCLLATCIYMLIKSMAAISSGQKPIVG
ncbi:MULTISPECIES: MFS transporter [Pseudomonadati]|uniref:MFS transporter n=1 Tax=Shewanella aestuarii TaxID=1028752 RepID=A0ABT0L4P3_9GAMM|nr:MFS transporter [Shewanella aestuarii]MCL1118372.1 MFS transporter [Shewanella aestuarii]GGN81031.1 MFS transporter [Shewanella aestuarii]